MGAHLARRVRVRILGDLSLAPASVQASAARLMQASNHDNPAATINICFSYT
jgi:undecaprenyl pyrophosphate synthase